MSTAVEGFILHSYARTKKGRTALYLLGRLQDGSTFAIIENRYQPNFYIRESDCPAVEQAVNSLAAAELRPSQLRTMDGEICLQVCASTQEVKRRIRDALQLAGVRTYEADLRVADQFRLERQVHGPVRIRGQAKAGRYVGRVFVDPEVEPGQWRPRLSVLSIDIETDIRTQAVRAVALSPQDPFQASPDLGEVVLFLGPELHEPGVECFSDEKALLLAFRDRVVRFDPDVLN